LAVDAGSIWLIGIPVSVVLAFGFHLPIETVYLGFMCDELFKVIVVTHRLRTRKWMNVLTT
jgi:Na+-driven multidrug efflux pump